MKCILSPENKPAFNLAAEEYLFKNGEEDVVFLYVNKPSVIVGKHQNALAEVNPWYVWEKEIEVVRRLSGGGAVYHDPGNLNFSFHKTVDDPAKVSFKSFNEPLVEFLNSLGVPAEISPRNDIFVEGFKISGHAEHVFRKRILSHGTLLFNASRENLSKALKNTSGKYEGKAIQSVRSKVANIIDVLPTAISMQEFVNKTLHFFMAQQGAYLYEFIESDRSAIEKLADEKYNTWEWNYGYSPTYRFSKSGENKQTILSITLDVKKGILENIETNGFWKGVDTHLLTEKLKGLRHEKNEIQAKLKELNLPEALHNSLYHLFF